MKEMKNEEVMGESEDSSPLDSIIARVQSYKENPKLATPETLGELVSELEDLKTYMDGESTEGPMHKGKGGGLTVILGSQK